MRNDIIIAAFQQQKDVFREALRDLVGVNFSNCGISIDPSGYLVIAGDVFDVGYMPLERSPEARYMCDIFLISMNQ